MDFFTQQEKARKKTGLLVFFFISAVVLIIAALYGTITLILLWNKAIHSPFQPEILFAVIGGTAAVVIIGSFYKMHQLKQGGSAVAEMLGARPVAMDTRDLKEKQLLNVVEEMSIASGTAMPRVYIMEEQGINAFAAGWKRSDAAVCVTRGCLESLTRDELQGVIAHEFSHIFNGDMRLNIKLMGIIFGILVIGQIGYWILRGTGRSGGVRVRSSKSKGGGGAAVVMLVALALLIIGYIGVFFGNLIKAAVSRHREFLADASAVQFTRNPSGISGALKKIGGQVQGSRIMHANAAQASHLFFANGLAGFWSSIFATHPPIDKRIKAIEPGFNGEFPAVARAVPLDDSNLKDAKAEKNGASGIRASVAFNPALLVDSIGSPTPDHVAYSSRLMTAIPNQLRLAVLDRIGAQAAVSALLLSRDPVIREKQEQAVAVADARLMQRIAELEPMINDLDRSSYATVCSLAINALRSMNAEESLAFSTLIKSLVEADEKVDLFEYMLIRMVKRYLAARYKKKAKPGASIGSHRAVAPEIAIVLSCIAWETADSPAQAVHAIEQGIAFLPGMPLSLISRELCSLASLDTSLEKLDRLVPLQKKQVLSACVSVATTDGLITINEAEYIRVIADALECPIPPLIIS